MAVKTIHSWFARQPGCDGFAAVHAVLLHPSTSLTTTTTRFTTIRGRATYAPPAISSSSTVVHTCITALSKHPQLRPLLLRRASVRVRMPPPPHQPQWQLNSSYVDTSSTAALSFFFGYYSFVLCQRQLSKITNRWL